MTGWQPQLVNESVNVLQGYLSSQACISHSIVPRAQLTFNSGFFGMVPGSLLQQVGRGYTDLLSAVLAVGLEASELQIWKEVDGIFTADPRKVPTARLLPVISPDEAAELSYYGSEVVHPFTMEQVGSLVHCPLSVY
jgi:aspartate kinase